MDRHFKKINNRSFVWWKYEKNGILGFELNDITENQDGVDEATGKLTQILHSISDKARHFINLGGKRRKITDNRGQIM
jgi:phage-related protein